MIAAAPTLRALPRFLTDESIRERAASGATMGFAGLLEVAVFQLALYGQMPVWVALIFHGIIGALLVALAVIEAREAELSRATLIFTVLTLIAGPFGAVAAGLALVTAAIAPRHPPGDDVPKPHGFLCADGHDAPRRGVPETHFLDTFAFGNLEERLDAVEHLGSAYEPRHRKALRAALRDPSSQIRVAALSAATRLRTQFTDLIARLETQSPRTREIDRALAEANEVFADSGLLERAQAQQRRAVALSHYASVLEAEPADLGALEAIGRILIGDNRYSEAAACLRDCLDCGGLEPGVFSLYLDCLLNLGHTDELRAIATQSVARGDEDETGERLFAAFALWREGGEDLPEAAHG